MSERDIQYHAETLRRLLERSGVGVSSSEREKYRLDIIEARQRILLENAESLEIRLNAFMDAFVQYDLFPYEQAQSLGNEARRAIDELRGIWSSPLQGCENNWAPACTYPKPRGPYRYNKSAGRWMHLCDACYKEVGPQDGDHI